MSGDPTFIPLCEPHLGGNEWTYVKECLDTGWVSSAGSFVDRFERDFARYVGSAAAVATANGTSALHMALLVAGVRPDDEVLVSTLTFIAPVNAIRYANAWPVLMDAEPHHWQMDADKVSDFITSQCEHKGGELRNKTTGRRVSAILPVHILGHPVDMLAITQIAREHDLRVIEDATESLGAVCGGRPVGTLGDIACFSFNGNKLMTTGGGGMITTDNATWAEQAKHLTTQAKMPGGEFVHDQIGYNYRLTNMAAAMGCAQLERISRHLSRKKQIADRYIEAFSDTEGIQCMKEAGWARSAWWLFTVRLCGGANSPSRPLMRALRQKGIETRPLWQPMHRSPAHPGCQSRCCEVADRLHEEGLSLPCSVGLTDEQQETVIREVQQELTSIVHSPHSPAAPRGASRVSIVPERP